MLAVLGRGAAAGDAMWPPEAPAGDVALMRVPVGLFSAAAPDAPGIAYAQLPKPDGYTVQNRFVGDTLLYGAGAGWGYAQPTSNNHLFLVPIRGSRIAADTVKLPHGVDRIEALAKNPIVVGGDGTNLHFTAISLANRAIAGSYVRAGAVQG